MWSFIDNVAPSWTVSQVGGMFCVERETICMNYICFPWNVKYAKFWRKKPIV